MINVRRVKSRTPWRVANTFGSLAAVDATGATLLSAAVSLSNLSSDMTAHHP
jgi:hypothetical protein